MLRITDLRLSYIEPGGSQLPVLDIADWRLGASEQVVLLGRSGSGKTTLLHVIAGLTLPDEGEVSVDGQDITRLPETDRDRFRAVSIGSIFQTLNLLDGFTALENVLLGMTFGGRRPDERRARELLGRVGLGNRLRHRPQALSVGERQRVAVARALVGRPKILLADEPTAHLDPRNQQQVLDLVRSACREEGVALLIVTHAPEISDQFDRIETLESFNRAVASVQEVAS